MELNQSLKSKTAKGLFWSLVETISSQGFNFIIGIVLARILLPSEFGAIGVVAIFISFSTLLIDSGFSQALIRKKDCSDEDYSTVFYFNIGVAFLIFTLFYLFSNTIENYFDISKLSKLIRVIGFGIVIDSFSIIHRTILAKKLDFKIQTRVTIYSQFISGIIAVVMAFNGFGVWSLVFRLLIQQFISTILFWYKSTWQPKFIFNFSTINKLSSFSFKLMLSGFINAIFENLSSFFIAKNYSVSQLAYYNRAQSFSDLPSRTITAVVSRVTYSSMSNFQEDKFKLREVYQKTFKGLVLVMIVVMLFLAMTAEPLVITLVGEKWSQSILYLKLLTVIGFMYPLHALNLNMILVLGRSDLFFRLEIIKKLIAIPILLFFMQYSISIMIYGLWIINFISYFINAYWSKKLIDYSILNQILDIKQFFFFTLIFVLILGGINTFLPVSLFWKFILSMVSIPGLVYFLLKYTNPDFFEELKQLFFVLVK